MKTPYEVWADERRQVAARLAQARPSNPVGLLEAMAILGGLAFVVGIAIAWAL